MLFGALVFLQGSAYGGKRRGGLHQEQQYPPARRHLQGNPPQRQQQQRQGMYPRSNRHLGEEAFADIVTGDNLEDILEDAAGDDDDPFDYRLFIDKTGREGLGENIGFTSIEYLGSGYDLLRGNPRYVSLLTIVVCFLLVYVRVRVYIMHT